MICVPVSIGVGCWCKIIHFHAGAVVKLNVSRNRPKSSLDEIVQAVTPVAVGYRQRGYVIMKSANKII